MEKLKKLRTPVLSNFTKLTTEIQDVLQAKNIDLDVLSSSLNKIE